MGWREVEPNQMQLPVFSSLFSEVVFARSLLLLLIEFLLSFSPLAQPSCHFPSPPPLPPPFPIPLLPHPPPSPPFPPLPSILAFLLSSPSLSSESIFHCCFTFADGISLGMTMPKNLNSRTLINCLPFRVLLDSNKVVVFSCKHLIRF